MGNIVTFQHLVLGNAIDSKLQKIVDYVSVIGGTAFTLAVLVIALFIIFGSISAQKMRTVWISLISCIIGAIIFFSASQLTTAIKEIAK